MKSGRQGRIRGSTWPRAPGGTGHVWRSFDRRVVPQDDGRLFAQARWGLEAIHLLASLRVIDGLRGVRPAVHRLEEVSAGAGWRAERSDLFPGHPLRDEGRLGRWGDFLPMLS